MLRRLRPAGAAIALTVASIAALPASADAVTAAPAPLPAISVAMTYATQAAPQTFTVPSGVSSIGIDIRGAQGQDAGRLSFPQTGGLGARITGTLTVTPGETLCVNVGSRTGRNGGGAGGAAGGGSGGGASDLRRGGCALADRLVVAGGGGGGGGLDDLGILPPHGSDGGAAGSDGGGAGSTRGGTAATTSGAGLGGSGVNAGATAGLGGELGQGGAGGTGAYGGGGGGGGGLYGGGGGGGGGISSVTFQGYTTIVSGPAGSGGGGGSSLVPNATALSLATSGGDGEVTITFPDVTAPVATITSPSSSPVVGRGSSTLKAQYSCADAELVDTCAGAASGSSVADGAALPTDSEGTFTLTVTATDKAARTAQATATYRVDGTAPTTTDDVPTAAQDGPTPVHLSATDGPAGAAAGVARIYYTVGAAPTTPTTSSAVYGAANPPTLQRGERIRYFAVDRVGNAELPKTSRALAVRPTVALSLATVSSAAGDAFDLSIATASGGAFSRSGAGNGASGSLQVDGGQDVTVSVVAAAGTPAGAYDLAIDCGSGGATTTGSLVLSNVTADRSCTATATYRPKITVDAMLTPGDLDGSLTIEVGGTTLLTRAGNGASASTRVTRGSNVSVTATAHVRETRTVEFSMICRGPTLVNTGQAATDGASMTHQLTARGDFTCTATLIRPPTISFTSRELPSGNARAMVSLEPTNLSSDASSGSWTVASGGRYTLAATGPSGYSLAMDCGTTGSSSTDDAVVGTLLNLGPLTSDVHCDITLRRWPTLSARVEVLPATDPLRVDASIGGTPVISGGADGAAGSRAISPGTEVSVQASLPSGVDLAAYDRTVSCGAAVADGSTAQLTVTQDAQCTFSFRRKQQLTVTLARPAGSAAFDLKVGDTVVKAEALDGERGSVAVSYGKDVRVSAAASDPSLASTYDLQIDCGEGASAPASALTLAPITARTCTITATLRREPPSPSPSPSPAPQAAQAQPTRAALTLAASAPRAVVAISASTSLRARCTVSRPGLRGCRIVASDAAGNRVGAGELSAEGARRSGVVTVVLSRAALQRAGLASRVLTVTLRAEATAAGSTERATASRSILVVPAVVRVGFAPGTATLTPTSHAALQRIASALRRARAVECSGYVSTLLAEPTAFGATLAGRRAGAVCSALRSAGLAASYVVRSRGAGRTIGANTSPRGRALNRRVELRITL